MSAARHLSEVTPQLCRDKAIHRCNMSRALQTPVLNIKAATCIGSTPLYP